MTIGSTKIPKKLIKALKSGELVIFAGAGVSMGAPASLPNFDRPSGKYRGRKWPVSI